LFLFAGIGGFFAPLLLNWADRIVGTQWGYLGIALLTLPVILWLLRTPAPTRREHQDGEAERPFKPLLFAAFCILVFTFIGGEVGFSGWIYTYIVESGVGDEAGAALLNSLFWLAMSAGRLAAIPLSARFRPSQLVLFNLVATFCSLGLIVLLPGRTAAVWFGSLASGFFLSSIFPTSFAFLERQMDITGWRTGLIWSFGSMGGITLPWLLGVQIDAFGPQSMMYILSALWGIAVLIFALVFFRTRHNRTAGFAT
jgi:fucose permease